MCGGAIEMDLTDGQIKTLKLHYSRQDTYPFWVDIYKKYFNR